MNEKSDKELAQIIWDYMRYEQPPQKADVIIGFGCNDMRVADHCAILFQKGYAPLVLFSGSRGELTRGIYHGNEADLYRERALALGVPDTAIITESRAENSGQNMAYSYKKLKEKAIAHDTLLLVHKPYMLRRMYATYMKQWPEQPAPRATMSAIDMTMDQYVTDAYIDMAYMTNIMVGDLQRIIEYPKSGYQIEQAVPADVYAAYRELIARGYTKHLLK